MPELIVPQGSTAGGYRLLEHTADMGIEAWADSLDALFIAAARGLQEILFGQAGSAEGHRQLKVELQAEDEEELLVAWLGEVLFLVQQRGFCPAFFVIEEIGRQKLKGSLVGGYQQEGSGPLREVKAITYHLLRVLHRDNRWQARVYLDL
jgi:SHS2 domain-containing protein